MANKNFRILNILRVLILLGSASALGCHVVDILMEQSLSKPPNPAWTSSSSKLFVPYILYFTASGISLFSIVIILLGACCGNRSVSADKSLGITNILLWVAAIAYNSIKAWAWLSCDGSGDTNTVCWLKDGIWLSAIFTTAIWIISLGFVYSKARFDWYDTDYTEARKSYQLELEPVAPNTASPGTPNTTAGNNARLNNASSPSTPSGNRGATPSYIPYSSPTKYPDYRNQQPIQPVYNDAPARTQTPYQYGGYNRRAPSPTTPPPQHMAAQYPPPSNYNQNVPNPPVYNHPQRSSTVYSSTTTQSNYDRFHPSAQSSYPTEYGSERSSFSPEQAYAPGPVAPPHGIDAAGNSYEEYDESYYTNQQNSYNQATGQQRVPSQEHYQQQYGQQYNQSYNQQYDQQYDQQYGYSSPTLPAAKPVTSASASASPYEVQTPNEYYSSRYQEHTGSPSNAARKNAAGQNAAGQNYYNKQKGGYGNDY